MYTSDEKKERRTVWFYLGITIFTMVFGLVYEYFSHGVFSWHMAFLFVFPLAGGAFPYTLLCFLKSAWDPDWITACLWNSGVAALTVGSCIQGVLEIYGTTSGYLPVYYIAGGFFAVSGLIKYFFGRK